MKITIDVPASELPASVVAQLPRPPVPGERFRVTVEPVEDRAAKLEALRRDIAEGIAEADRGEVEDAAEVFRELRARFTPARNEPACPT